MKAVVVVLCSCIFISCGGSEVVIDREAESTVESGGSDIGINPSTTIDGAGGIAAETSANQINTGDSTDVDQPVPWDSMVWDLSVWY